MKNTALLDAAKDHKIIYILQKLAQQSGNPDQAVHKLFYAKLQENCCNTDLDVYICITATVAPISESAAGAQRQRPLEKELCGKMTDPKKLKRIFRELREELGDELSSLDLLCLAFAMLRLSRNEDLDKVVEFPRRRRSFEELGIDEALSDGGWSIMSRERALMRAAFDDDESHNGIRYARTGYQVELAA